MGSRRRLSLSAAALIAFAVVVPAVGMESAKAGPVRIVKVQYDSLGKDTGSNKSLNKEWIRIHNFGNKAKQLKGWTIRDTSGHVYHFKKYLLKPGKSVTLHTGSHQDQKPQVYWHSDGYVWNNTGDKAILKNKSGTKVEQFQVGGRRRDEILLRD
jgi:Lamin Tail Domain